MPANKVKAFLSDLGLERYFPIFESQEIDDEVIADLTAEDLVALDIPLGPRKKLLKAINAMESEMSSEVMKRSPDHNSDATLVDTGEASWRQLTVLFCDLVGSTELSQKIGAESLMELNRKYQESCARVINSYQGFVARYMGDGVLAYFGFPEAHENDAERAILAGLNLVELIKSLDLDSLCNAEFSPRIRVGIASGRVVVGDIIGEGASQESAVVGETPNLAARLQGVAVPNSVVISDETRKEVGAYLHCKSLGLQQLKGFKEPVEPWEVVKVDVKEDRIQTRHSEPLHRFIGRVAEIEQLENDWNRVCNGAQVLALVTGEAGIGKSRLVYELQCKLGNSANILTGHCASHGSSKPYSVFIDLLYREFGAIDSDDISAQHQSKVISNKLSDLNIIGEYQIPYLMNLIHAPSVTLSEMDAGLVALRTRETLATLIKNLAKSTPTLLLLNDCHWIDGSSEMVLDVLSKSLQSYRLFVICTARPEYEPNWNPSEASRISLQPFSSAETKVLLEGCMEHSKIDHRMIDILSERSGGNPLFAEELAQHVRNSGGEDYLSTKINLDMRALAVPKSLESLLLNRVDRLDRECRVLIQAASVIGRSFSLTLASSVCKSSRPDEIVNTLLERKLLIHDLTAAKDRYRFRHALVQDTVYNSMLLSDRKALHLTVATQLEIKYSDNDSNIVEEIARHYILAENSELAARWAARAGIKALGLFAIKDAILWFGHSLEFIRTSPDTKSQILGPVLVNQLESLCWDINYPAMLTLADQFMAEVRDVGDLKHVSRAYSWLADAYINTGRFSDALEDLTSARDIAKSLNDLECKGYAHGMLIWLHAITFECGRASYIEDGLDEAIQIADDLGDSFLKVLVYYSAALDLAHQGKFALSRQWAAKSIELGEIEDYPPGLTYGHCVRSFANMLEGLWNDAVLDAQEAVRIAASKYDKLMSRMTLGSALILSGDVQDGLKILDEVNKERESLSMIGFMYWPDVVFAYGLTLSGKDDEGLNLLESYYHKFLELGNPRAAALAANMLGDVLHSRGEIRASEFLSKSIELGQQTAMNQLVKNNQGLLGSK